MLKIAEKTLAPAALATLKTIQDRIDGKADYPARVAAADAEWKAKLGSAAKKEAFATIRTTLAEMCVGSVRCTYCEDSLADEVEHIEPKNLFPHRAFLWANYLFACGPCNGPKSNRYGVVAGDQVDEFIRRRGDPIVPPAAGAAGLINPRSEDPFDFLELDIGGVAHDGSEIAGTFMLLPRDELVGAKRSRAKFTIDVLGLNREAIRAARENAFGGFRARIREYVAEKEAGRGASHLAKLREGILKTPHLSVFEDMRRQRFIHPELADFFARAPEILAWAVVPAM